MAVNKSGNDVIRHPAIRPFCTTRKTIFIYHRLRVWCASLFS